MSRLKASDFDPEVLRLFDKYVHGALNRRQFLDKAAPFAKGVTAAALLASLSPNYSRAQQVAEDDRSISSQRMTYRSPKGHGSINGYLVRPASGGPHPAVLVVHENRGLNPYIEDVARRCAKAGYFTLAPDGLTPKGGYPGNDDDGRKLQAELDREKLFEDFRAAVDYLLPHRDSTGKVGAVGFCFGGGISNALAVNAPDLAAAVPFYGRQPPASDVPKIKAPLLLHYAELDERINAGWPAYETALKENGKTYTAHMYQGVNHGFHNDSTPRYDKESAALAWERTLAFFKEHLS